MTGSILGAGEELRPTGTNRALLGRLTEMTGGKLRDTLAGIFRDRTSRRFAYDPLTAPLVVIRVRRQGLRLRARPRERRARGHRSRRPRRA